MLIAASYQLLANSFQLSSNRAVVNRAAHSDDSAAQNRRILQILRANFFPRQLRDSGLEFLPLVVAQIPGAGHLGLGKTQSVVKILLELFHNRFEKLDAPMINEHRDEIAHHGRNPEPLRYAIQNPNLLVGRNRRRFPDHSQFAITANQSGERANLRNRLFRIEALLDNYIGKSASVGTGDGSHESVSLFPAAVTQLIGEVANQGAIGPRVDLNLFSRQRNRQISRIRG